MRILSNVELLFNRSMDFLLSHAHVARLFFDGKFSPTRKETRYQFFSFYTLPRGDVAVVRNCVYNFVVLLNQLLWLRRNIFRLKRLIAFNELLKGESQLPKTSQDR